MTVSPSAIKLHADDNVAVLIHTLKLDVEVLEGVRVAEPRISRGHKIATQKISCGEHVLKYGQIIGVASQDIEPGQHVHVHNLDVGQISAKGLAGTNIVDVTKPYQNRTFDGFRRPDGKVGTRNYIGILTSVNCSATVARLIAQACERHCILEQFTNVDGIIPLVHGTGCAR